MLELKFLDIIKNSLDNPSLIGDDCAYLDDLGIFVTHDTLVENVHFSRYTTTPYLLGRKAISVNLSDLASSLAQPLYISVSLSLPKTMEEKFITQLYKGINEVCAENNVMVTGGDITGSEKIVISVCAIGKKISNFLSSRSFAKKGDYILVTGNFGSSALGFHALSNFLYAENSLINAHLNPISRNKEALFLAKNITNNIAMMDCSDGLADALYKISLNSRHALNVDLEKVPVSSDAINYCKRNLLDCLHYALWGGEDYELLLCVDENTFKNLDLSLFNPIGRVFNKVSSPCVIVNNGDKSQTITKEIFEKNSFNHF